jgi:hypothetical protein
MRRVKTHNINNNPLAMFAVGVEQIVSDHMSQPSKYDDQELRAMQRSPKKQADTGNLFSILIQQLFWQNTRHQS